ncbi:hypothetical protein [Thiohalorhabdus denitrificans]|uniref:Lipoprotein n=1 Tax=Thiohalorhabdus denitrificans TaxID=381306 RepID=A0A1G5HTX2_9GAMM|nr:hypothetical protein [Thiohalorhabdus denitrificans]SCY66478.1 hypothetical protein SAMN05661077_0078 [Thiohalorhabdus denitrificans]
MKRLSAFSLLLPLLITGCATGGLTPDGLRSTASGGGVMNFQETYEVDRPYNEVAKTLEAQAKECLHQKVVRRACYGMGACSETTLILTPSVVHGEEATEVHVQLRAPEYTPSNEEVPEDGAYITVADAAPEGTDKTVMDVYSSKSIIASKTAIPNAIKHWAKGTNLGCPNLSGS